MEAYFCILLMQICYSVSDILARKELAKSRSYWKTLRGRWIIPYVVLGLTGVFIHLYVYHLMYMGRAMIFKSCLALILSAVVGSLFLHEKMTLKQGVALLLVFGAIFIQGMR